MRGGYSGIKKYEMTMHYDLYNSTMVMGVFRERGYVRR